MYHLREYDWCKPSLLHTHSLDCSLSPSFSLFLFLLLRLGLLLLFIQRPIDTYCNRFVVGHRHSFSLPSELQNRIEKKREEKKRKEKAKRSAMNSQWRFLIFLRFLSCSLLGRNFHWRAEIDGSRCCCYYSDDDDYYYDCSFVRSSTWLSLFE